MRINYVISAESREAEAANARVEAGLQRVQAAVKYTGDREKDLERARAFAAKDADARIKALERTWREQDKAREQQWREEDKRLRAQSKQTGQVESDVKALGRTLMAVFAVDLTMGFVRGLAQAAGEIKDTSAALGISTRSFQGFKFAIEDSGGTVNDLTQSIATMSKNLAGGNRSAGAALQSLNLDLGALRKMKPDEAFLAIADAIRDTDDPMRKMQSALAIFGETGRKILPAIQKDIRKLSDEAAALGLILDAGGIEALDKFNDRWTRAELVVKGAISRMLGAIFQLNDAIANGAPPWLSDALRRTVDSTPVGAIAGVWEHGFGGVMDRAWNRALLGGETNGPSVPTAPGSPTALMPAYRNPSIDDLLKIEVAAPAIQRVTKATKEQGLATAETNAEVERYLRNMTQVIGVNHDAFARGPNPMIGGIAGAIQPTPWGTWADITIPSTNPLNMAWYPDLYSGAIRSGMPQPVPAAGAGGGGFWAGRGGQVVGAGIGVAGGVAMGAMAGGDPYASMVGGAASAMGGAALAGTIGSTVALGAATMGIGAAAVGIYMLAKHFMTVSKEVKQARVDIAEFQQELWKTATSTQMNEAAGRDWAATTIVVRDAYDRMGLSAQAAEADVAQLFDDRNPERAREAMQRIANVMEDLQNALAKANTEMATLLGQASALATRLPQSMLDQLTALVDRGDLTGANVALVDQLKSADEINFAQFKARADALGLDPNALGGVYAQHRTTSTAQQYIDDIDLFRKGGVEMGTVLSGMKEELSGMVQEALRFGTEIPENMRPFIQNLFDTGQLLDENGEAMSDISDLKWGEALETSTDRLIDSIKDLINTLSGPLTAAFGNIPREVTTRLRVDADDIPDDWDFTRRRPDGPDSDDPYRAMTGGVVPQYLASGGVAGLFRPRYTDTVPAMLTPGEGVLSRRGMQMLGRLNAGAGGGGSATVNVNVNGAVVSDHRTARMLAEVVRREFTREMSRERKFSVVG